MENNTHEYVDMIKKELSLLDTDEYIKKNGDERASMEEFLKKIEPLNYNDYHILLKAYLSSSSDKDILEKRRTLEVLLDGDESDRSLAYLLLNECWDNYFFEKIISVYNQYHEDLCFSVICAHYPVGSLKGKIDENEVFKDKMAPYRYLERKSLFDKEISHCEAEEILYKTIVNTLYLYLYRYNNPQQPPTLLSIYPVECVISTMGALGMKESLKSFALICHQADEILDTNLQTLKRYRGRIFDEIISLLPPEYQTTNAEIEFDKYVDITKHCADPKDVES